MTLVNNYCYTLKSWGSIVANNVLTSWSMFAIWNVMCMFIHSLTHYTSGAITLYLPHNNNMSTRRQHGTYMFYPAAWMPFICISNYQFLDLNYKLRHENMKTFILDCKLNIYVKHSNATVADSSYTGMCSLIYRLSVLVYFWKAPPPQSIAFKLYRGYIILGTHTGFYINRKALNVMYQRTLATCTIVMK